MHKTLERQLRHSLGEAPVLGEEWKDFLDSVSLTYDDFDKDRVLIERSLEISSRELKGLIALLQATLDSMNQGIIVTDKSGKLLNHNMYFMETWQIPEEVVKVQEGAGVLAYIIEHVLYPPVFRKYIEHAQQAVSSVSEKNTCIVELQSGKIVEVDSRVYLVDGVDTGRVWSFNDVTEERRVEGELRSKLIALERLNKAMVNRELKMIELKKKIKSLEKHAATQS